MAKTHFLDPNVVINSQNCYKVINKLTGSEFDPSQMDGMSWSFVYQRAAMHPEEFECLYGKKTTSEDKVIYTAADLKAYDVSQLQTIATEFGVGGTGKKSLIENILTAQAAK